MVKRAELEVKLKVEYVPVPADQVHAWRASLSVILDLLYEERDIHKQDHSRISCAWFVARDGAVMRAIGF